MHNLTSTASLPQTMRRSRPSTRGCRERLLEVRLSALS